MLLYFLRPKHPSGNCYVNCFLTDRAALAATIDLINSNQIDAKYHQMVFRSVLVHLLEILEE